MRRALHNNTVHEGETSQPNDGPRAHKPVFVNEFVISEQIAHFSFGAASDTFAPSKRTVARSHSIIDLIIISCRSPINGQQARMKTRVLSIREGWPRATLKRSLRNNISLNDKDFLFNGSNGAKKRASLHKKLEAFRKCAKSIINNGMDATDQSLFKPNEIRARLEQIGITTRVATIKANSNLTKEARPEVSKALLTMQKDYSQKNIEKAIAGKNVYRNCKT